MNNSNNNSITEENDVMEQGGLDFVEGSKNDNHFTLATESNDRDFVLATESDAGTFEFAGSNSPIKSFSSYSIDSDNSYVLHTPSKEIIKTKALNERIWLEFTLILFGSSILAFNAGFVNGCTFLSLMNKGKFVSHVTGTSTKVGVFLANNNSEDTLVSFGIIFSFCFGAMISGGYLSSSTFSLGLEYGPLLILGSILFLLSSMLLTYLPNTYLGFYAAAMACGLQNALTTSYSGNIIRTTHMTGTVTDIGVILGKVMFKGEFQDLWKLKILIPLFTSFILGGVISFYIFQKIGDLAICLSSAFFLGVGILYSFFVSRHMNKSCWKVFLGQILYVEKKFEEVKVKTIQKLSRKKRRKSMRKSVKIESLNANNVTNPLHFASTSQL